MSFTEEKTANSSNYPYQEEDIDLDEYACRNRGLWCAVITQALMDAGSNSKKTRDKKAKIDAIKWLREDSSYFLEVCFRANLDPKYVKRKAAEALNRGCKWRNDMRPKLPVTIATH